MKEVVIWSGGADSTKILYELAKGSSTAHPVLAYSVVHCHTNDNKQKKEKEARKNILKWMKEKGYHIKHKEIIIKSNIGYNTNEPSSWVCAVTPLLPPYCNVHFGYVYEDSFWHKRKEFEKAFNAITSIRVNHHEIKLFFDLEWTHKKDVIKDLKEIGLFKLIWTCERPTDKGKACGKCTPCKTLKENLDKLKEEGKKNDK